MRTPGMIERPATRRIADRRVRQFVAAAAIGCFTLGAFAAPVPVRTVPLAEVLEIPRFSAPATVVARNAPRLAAEIEARIVEIAVAVGDRVSTGALLARLDCRRHTSLLAARRADLARSTAQQGFAREQLQRARNLGKAKSISEELLDQRRTDLAVADADVQSAGEAVRQAEIDAGHCEIRAPFDAVVNERLASVGDFASRGTAVVAIVETRGQEISAALRQDQLDDFATADGLAFEANGTRYDVALRALLPLADPVARTREARLLFEGGESAVSGTAGRLTWRGPRSLLPADYLVRRDGRLGIFVLDAGQARFIALPSAEDGRPVRVALPDDTVLITEGRQRLVDGDTVNTVAPGD